MKEQLKADNRRPAEILLILVPMSSYDLFLLQKYSLDDVSKQVNENVVCDRSCYCVI